MAHTSGSASGAEGAPGQRPVGSERVLAVLIELAGRPDGASLEEIAAAVDSPKPTVHRCLASLRAVGLANQQSRGRYVLGDEFLRLAFAHHAARPDHVRVEPALRALVDRFGETSHYAVLAGRDVVYRSKADPLVSPIKLTSAVGGRNPAHCTAVGKVLLSYRLTTLDAVREWIGDEPLVARTERTLTDAAALYQELRRVRAAGYAVDDQENEPGVNCLAVPVFLGTPSEPSGAVSVSALAYRTPAAALVDALPEIRAVLGEWARPA